MKKKRSKDKAKQIDPVTKFPRTLRSPVTFNHLEKDAEKKRINKEITHEKRQNQEKS